METLTQQRRIKRALDCIDKATAVTKTQKLVTIRRLNEQKSKQLRNGNSNGHSHSTVLKQARQLQ